MQVHIKVYGRVQGVFFRSNAAGEAQKLGLLGWVRNNADGTVEAVAKGEKGKLEKFVDWCKKGPPLAKVKKVEVDWQETDSGFESFEVI